MQIIYQTESIVTNANLLNRKKQKQDHYNKSEDFL